MSLEGGDELYQLYGGSLVRKYITVITHSPIMDFLATFPFFKN